MSSQNQQCGKKSTAEGSGMITYVIQPFLYPMLLGCIDF